MELVDASSLDLPWPAQGRVAVMVGRDILGLPLDHGELGEWLREPQHRIAGVIVRGDLRAKYPIVNGSEKGPFLWVQGDLKAPAVLLRTSRVRIDGDVDCPFLHGPLEVLGDARATVVQGGPITIAGSLAATLALGDVIATTEFVAFRTNSSVRQDLRTGRGVSVARVLHALEGDEPLLEEP